ncbi:MAG: hypothetical protein M3300_12585 [Actinomycetota bacterium]|nr:hypothetical protein [Actinomycetota bacterium]
MTAHLTPGSGRKDSGYFEPRFGSNDPMTGLGLRGGESDPARMLSGVLILVFVAVVVGLMMTWWLI